jgi:RNase H-fold protein (predicted Holliday junction resolvase)
MIAGNMRREKRKELKDEMAAVVILQDYLDRK